MGNGKQIAIILIVGGFVTAIIVMVSSVLGAINAFSGNVPELAHTYMVMEGLPDDPVDTVLEYQSGMEEVREGRWKGLIPLLVLLVFVVIFFMVNMTIGKEGLTGLLQQARLTMHAWNRRGQATGRPSPGDDDWIQEALNRPPQPSLPVVNTPWLLPANSGEEEG